MQNQPMRDDRPVNPHRRKRTKKDIFRESYLPVLIAAVAVLAVIGIIAGVIAIVDRSHQSTDPDGRESTVLEQQAKDLLKQAQKLAEGYDYDGALALLESFDGDLQDFPRLKDAIEAYALAKSSMVAWTAAQVPNLSFHTLIADLEAALADGTYGSSGNGKYNRNFITTAEFSAILQQLYENDYVLVSLPNLYSYDAAKKTYVEQELMLPAGKKPILLTQTHCNYYTYMAESHAFAARLIEKDGVLCNEMLTSSGKSIVGNYDFVPILESFISEHPDFSYKGARAILAMSGYDGIFGYRISSDTLSAEALAQEQQEAGHIVSLLTEAGYTLACYTYANTDYSAKSAKDIRSDIRQWEENIASVTGSTDIFVFAQGGDIGTSYENNEKFDVLYEFGYRYFLGSAPLLSSDAEPQYVRQSRLMVTASNLSHHADWFKDILDTADLLDTRRGTIPQ